MKAINVLIVDDDMAVQKLAHYILAGRGIKLWKAYDTTEADIILQRHAIDVILCDVVMTPENGLAYYNRLRARRVSTPVILMSSQVSPVGMQEGVKDGSASYMMKPFGIDQVYQRILEALVQVSDAAGGVKFPKACVAN